MKGVADGLGIIAVLLLLFVSVIEAGGGRKQKQNKASKHINKAFGDTEFDREFKHSLAKQKEQQDAANDKRTRRNEAVDDLFGSEYNLSELFVDPRPTKVKNFNALTTPVKQYRIADEDEDDDSSDSSSASLANGIGRMLAPDFELSPNTPATNFVFDNEWLKFAYGELGSKLRWKSIPEEEQPTSSNYIGEFTYIYTPVLYGNEAEQYGIPADSWIPHLYFAIYVRRYRHKKFNLPSANEAKHVMLIAGGPGYSGAIWGETLDLISRQYDHQTNVMFYAPDHRGVHKSRGIFLKIQDDLMVQFRNGRENVKERTWVTNPRQLEVDLGFPLVGMSSNAAARDFVIISKAIAANLPKSTTSTPRIDAFYLHAESYGTQVATKMLNYLPRFFDGILLDGLATMELASESAKAEKGILSACQLDSYCRDMILNNDDHVKNSRSNDNIVALRTVFDLKKLVANMETSPNNITCRRQFVSTLSTFYSFQGQVSFWRILQMLSFDLLAEDFINDYSRDSYKYGSFYLGQLLLPFLKQLYYCNNPLRFQQQLTEIQSIISKIYASNTIIQAKNRGTEDSNANSSYFVATYINTHEAFDLHAASTNPTEIAFCQQPNQPHLTNQCFALKDMAYNRRALLSVSGKRGLLEKELTEFVEMVISGFAEPTDSVSSKSHGKSAISKSSHHSISPNAPPSYLSTYKYKPSNPKRQYTYQLDALSYQMPQLQGRSQLIVIAGSLDIKTPANTALRYFNALRVTGGKEFFLLDNVAHYAYPCRKEITKAFITSRSHKAAALNAARQCAERLQQSRMLDWPMQTTKDLKKSIWT